MIPKEKRNIFQSFFKDFDQKMDELEIKSYGVSITTLEEVFLAVNAEMRQDQDPNIPPMAIGVEDENPDEVALIDAETPQTRNSMLNQSVDQ